MRYPVPEEYWGGMVGLLMSVVRNKSRGLPVGTGERKECNNVYY